MSPPVWDLTHELARLRLDQVTAEVNLLDPMRGLHRVQFGTHDWTAAELLGVDLDLSSSDSDRSLLDAYVRGGDLVATYAQATDRPLRVQVYWRVDQSAFELDGIVIIDLQVSVQTDLLGIPPLLCVGSRLPEGNLLRLVDPASDRFQPLGMQPETAISQSPQLGPGCWLVRCSTGKRNYAEMIHPADYKQSTLNVADRSHQIRYELFAAGDLEKGVILRSRLRGMLLPQEADAAYASAGYQQLLTAALPLTV